MTIGEQVKLARQRAGMSQVELGRAASLSDTGLSAIETGKSHPSEPTIRKLESVLGPLSDEPPRDVPDIDTEAPQDEAPRPKKAAAPKKKAPAKRAGQFTLADQLELPYKLGSNLLAPRLPNTAAVLAGQARACAEAWDQFLYRYPALREKIEQGMIASDIVALLMVHAPIFQMAVAETRAINEAHNAQTYDGGIGAAA